MKRLHCQDLVQEQRMKDEKDYLRGIPVFIVIALLAPFILLYQFLTRKSI